MVEESCSLVLILVSIGEYLKRVFVLVLVTRKMVSFLPR